MPTLFAVGVFHPIQIPEEVEGQDKLRQMHLLGSAIRVSVSTLDFC
jgi:hypothetical protein